MKRIKPSETAHSNLNLKLMFLLKVDEDMGVTINFKLSDRLYERNLTIRKVAELTGLRIATISDLCVGKKGAINLQHILVLMNVLRITDMSDIIDIEFPDNFKQKAEVERIEWIKTGEIPSELLKENFDEVTHCEIFEECKK